jgi:membrane peptidoglycan carboxypeptidase
VADRHNKPLFSAAYPERTYQDFDEIPPIVVRSLLFIENRELLSSGRQYHNPAIEYDRFVKALLDVGLHALNPEHRVTGGSTIATQIEKFRHSARGRTDSVAEKGRQIVSASLRAYLDGESTVWARRRLVTEYLNSIPLGAIPGYGEVHGLGDGLWAWYGADLDAINAALASNPLQEEGPRWTAENRPLTDTAKAAIVGERSRLVSSTSSRPRRASRSALSSASCAARTSARARDAASDRAAR